REKKRADFNSFNKEKDEVLKEWQVYQFEQLMIHYALFKLMARYSDENEKGVRWGWFKDLSKSSQVEDLEEVVVSQYNSTEKEKCAVMGESLADIAHEISLESGDFELSNIFSNVLLSLELRKLIVKKGNE